MATATMPRTPSGGVWGLTEREMPGTERGPGRPGGQGDETPARRARSGNLSALDPDSRDDLPAFYDVTEVERGKERFARMVSSACYKFGYMRDGLPNTQSLSAAIGRNRRTVAMLISTAQEPMFRTVRALARETNTPIADWLEALHMLPPRSDDEVLRRLSEARLALLNRLEGWSDDDVEDLADLISRIEAHPKERPGRGGGDRGA